MSEEAQRQLTGSLERWQSFLATASRLYKYPYHEQVMIHAQRPDATACAEFDVWNNTMRRYVRRGSKGIALIDTSGDRERLRYVFDVSDTGTRPNSRSLNLWELQEEHIPVVSSMLEKNYGVPAGESLADQLEIVASQLAREYWEDNRRDILGILEDSFLEEYDEFNVGVAFRNAAEVSISYSLMLRCGLEPENYFEHEDFMSVFDFNTPETAGALGTAVSGINQQVLREIGATIRNYERQKLTERSAEYGNDVHAERGLSDPGHQTERTGGDTHREVRADAETVSEGASPDSLEPSGAVGAAVSAPSGDRRDGAPEAGRADAADGEAGRRDGGTEAQRPAEMGGHNEYAEGTGRGDYSERASVQLTAGEPEPPEELNNGYPAGAEFEQLFSIHDYFFAKTLDQVRPGGVIAFVTSRYTMDKQSPEVRRYIAQRAELLGAIRLPNNAFKANAGTDVVSDIIFLQKRDCPIEIEPDWVHLGRNEDGFAINSYFVEHPEMILGRQSSESTQYGRQDFTVEPIEGLELADQLHDAVKYIRGTYQAAELPELGDDEALSDSIPADPNVKNYSYTVVDGEIYYRQNSLMSRPALNATASERVRGLVGLRDCLHHLIDLQMDAMTPDSAIRQAQAELNTLYDSFTAKYGLINSRANALAFQDDSSYYLLCTLEELDEEKQLKRKADIFTKRTKDAFSPTRLQEPSKI